MTTIQQTAVEAIEHSGAAAYCAAALVKFDALDSVARELTLHDREEFATDIWNEFVDGRVFTARQMITLAYRAACHVTDGRMVDLLDARWGDDPTHLLLDDDGRALSWFPDRREVIIAWPTLGQLHDHHFGLVR